MLVNEITQITAHDWNVVNGYKRFVAALLKVILGHSYLSRIALIKASSAAIAIASDHN